jgi:hypothetical protein
MSPLARGLVLKTNLVKQTARSSTNHSLIIKDLEQALPHLAGLLTRIDGLPDTRLLVVRDNGRSLGVVGREALLKRLCVVVGALDERLARDVVGHGGLGRVEDLVVGAAGGGVDEAAGDARDEEAVVDLQFNGVLERLLGCAEHAVELFGLGYCAGESVEDEAVRGCVNMPLNV